MAKKTSGKSAGKAKAKSAGKVNRKFAKHVGELTASPAKRAAADKPKALVSQALPAGFSQPALRALARAGYTSLDHLAKIKDADLLKLHGLGPKGIETLRAALKGKR